MEEKKEQKTEKEAGAGAGGQSTEAKKIAPKEKNTGMAMVAYIVFFIPLLTESKDDPFVKFHIKQGLTLFVAWIAMGFASMIPLIGWTLAPFLSLAMLALMVIGIMNASKGEKKPLPLIGKYADNFKI